MRYDGFIASLIDEKRQLPKMTILSWNYDAQFEMAYSGYYLTERYIPTLWKELNVLNKTYYTEYDGTKDFAIIKLNGTAFFTDEDSPKLDIGEYCEERMIDTYYGGSVRTKYKHAVAFLSYPQYHNTLSYAWEKSKKVDLEGSIKQRVVEFVDKAVSRLLRHGVKRLHIMLLGDAAHGSIHNSCRVASEEDTCDQLMQASEILYAICFTSVSYYII